MTRTITWEPCQTPHYDHAAYAKADLRRYERARRRLKRTLKNYDGEFMISTGGPLGDLVVRLLIRAVLARGASVWNLNEPALNAFRWLEAAGFTGYLYLYDSEAGVDALVPRAEVMAGAVRPPPRGPGDTPYYQFRYVP